jgi:hypothetical protein
MASSEMMILPRPRPTRLNRICRALHKAYTVAAEHPSRCAASRTVIVAPHWLPLTPATHRACAAVAAALCLAAADSSRTPVSVPQGRCRDPPRQRGRHRPVILRRRLAGLVG